MVDIDNSLNASCVKIPIVKHNAIELAYLIINENEGPFNALYPCSSIRKDD